MIENPHASPPAFPPPTTVTDSFPSQPCNSRTTDSQESTHQIVKERSLVTQDESLVTRRNGRANSTLTPAQRPGPRLIGVNRPDASERLAELKRVGQCITPSDSCKSLAVQNSGCENRDHRSRGTARSHPPVIGRGLTRSAMSCAPRTQEMLRGSSANRPETSCGRAGPTGSGSCTSPPFALWG